MHSAPSTAVSLLYKLADPACEQAWATFIDRYSPYVSFRLRRAGFQPADVDDLQARVFARMVTAFRRIQYDPARRFRGYLARTITNTLRDYRRERSRRPFDGGNGNYGSKDLLEELSDFPGALDSLLLDRLDENANRIAWVRQEVGTHDWTAFWLTTVEELPGQEVADRLGRSRAGVYMAKSRVLAKLRLALGVNAPEN